MTCVAAVQINEAVWVSMMVSAMAGVIAVTLMIATFYCIRYAQHPSPDAATRCATLWQSCPILLAALTLLLT